MEKGKEKVQIASPACQAPKVDDACLLWPMTAREIRSVSETGPTSRPLHLTSFTLLPFSHFPRAFNISIQFPSPLPIYISPSTVHGVNPFRPFVPKQFPSRTTAMARSAVELDFFRMEKQLSPNPQPPKLFDRRRSFRDIQSVISKLNPEVLKAVIASGTVDQSSKSSENCNLSASSAPFSVPSTPKHDAFPVQASASGAGGSESTPEKAKMTIFYNGVVTIFEVPPHKAENILKLAGGGVPKIVGSADPKLAVSSKDQHQLLNTLNGDLPIARRKSLKRFLEKRKERLTLVSPYGCPLAEDGNSGKSASGGRDY